MVQLVTTMQGWAICYLASTAVCDVIQTIRSNSLEVTGASLAFFAFGCLCCWRECSVEVSHNGACSATEQATLEACIALIILCEVALFGGPAWVIVADHVSATGSDTVRQLSLASQFHHACYDGGGNGWSSSLTLVNSNILFGSGVLSVAAVHRSAAGHHGGSGALVATVAVVGALFIAVQCVEYAHLHTTVTTGGVAVFSTSLQGLHGFHVVVGLQAIVCGVVLSNMGAAVLAVFALCYGGSTAGSLAVFAY